MVRDRLNSAGSGAASFSSEDRRPSNFDENPYQDVVDIFQLVTDPVARRNIRDTITYIANLVISHQTKTEQAELMQLIATELDGLRLTIPDGNMRDRAKELLLPMVQEEIEKQKRQVAEAKANKHISDLPEHHKRYAQELLEETLSLYKQAGLQGPIINVGLVREALGTLGFTYNPDMVQAVFNEVNLRVQSSNEQLPQRSWRISTKLLQVFKGKLLKYFAQ